MIAFVIPGEAVPFARARGGNGIARFTPKKQRDFMATVKQIAADAMDGAPPLDGPVQLIARFDYLRPASHTKRQAACPWKMSKPDADNLVKIIKDALSKLAWRDDAQVCDLHVQKRYAPVARVTITLQAAA